MCWFLKGVPLSVMMVEGIPLRQMIWYRINLDTWTPIVRVRGMASTHLVIFYGGNDKLVSIWGRMDLTNKVKAPCRERPWCGNRSQILRWNMNQLFMMLTRHTFLDELTTIMFHGGPVVTHSQELFGKNVSTRMSTISFSVHFFHCKISFIQI